MVYGIITSLLLIIITKIFLKNDKELLLAHKDIIFYVLCAVAILISYNISLINLTYNYVFIIPTICIIFASYTDLCIEQIYTLVCFVNAIIGIIFIIIFNYNNFEFIKYALIISSYIIILFALKVINIGDVILLISLLPYFYLMFIENDIYLLTFLYLIGSFVIALLINFKSYFKYKKNNFPFALPALIAYVILIYYRSM